jgi:protein O-mannosyl-transferase
LICRSAQHNHSRADLSPSGAGSLRIAAISVLLLLAITLVFGQTHRYDFVNLDDNVGIYENPYVMQGLTAESLHWAFNNRLVENWGPLTWISHEAVWQFFGQDAGWHHLVNLALHALTAVLLFLVLQKMTAAVWASAFAAALWAIHPMRVESVAWVTERKDVLSGLFFMATLWAYAGYVRRQSPARHVAYATMMAVFALGLLSKPTLVTLPCVMLLLDYWPLRRFAASEATGPSSSTRDAERSRTVRLLIEKLPLFALSAACCAATFWAERVTEYPTRGAWWRIGNATIAYVDYLQQFFWPAGLALLYPRRPDVLPLWQVLAAAVVLLGVTAAAFIWRRKCPYLLTGWLWYLGTLLPAVGLVPFGNEAPADRFTYLPQIGLCVALAWSVADCCRGRLALRWVCGIASIAVLAALTGCAWQQTSYWRNSETLWNRSLACIPNNYWAHTYLGNDLARAGRADDAIVQFRKALAIKPDYADANYSMGVAEASRGRTEEAIDYYTRAVKANRNHALAQNNLGHALLSCGEFYKALEHLKEALRLNPDFAEAHYNCGLALHSLGHFPAAATEYKEAVRIRPDYAEAYYNLGVALDACGQLAEARYNNGRTLHLLGDLPNAIADYQRAIKLKPDFAEAHHYLGLALEASGRRDDAIAHYREALRTRPDFPEARKSLDLLLESGSGMKTPRQ